MVPCAVEALGGGAASREETAVAVLTVGTEVCECEGVLPAGGETAPLVAGLMTAAVLATLAAEEAGGWERLEEDELLPRMEGLLLDLRVEPTSLRNRLFI